MKFYICSHCGNIITFEKSSGAPVSCCGEQMKELIPGAVDAAVEKHVPAVKIDGKKVTVTVGEVAHPMTEAHYIMWIILETKNGSQKAVLTPSSQAKAEFVLSDSDEAVAAYAYCNLHGLWMKEI